MVMKKNQVIEIRLQIGDVLYPLITVTNNDHWPPSVKLKRFKTRFQAGLTGFTVMPRNNICISINHKPEKMFQYDEPVELKGIKSDGTPIVRRIRIPNQ